MYIYWFALVYFLSRFGYDSVERVLDWIEEKEEVSKDVPILDLGCGNGITLIELVSHL